MAKVQELLITINRHIQPVQRAQIVFLSESVLPVAKVARCKGNLLYIYKCLTSSYEWKDKALHLMTFFLMSVDCARHDELLPFMKAHVREPTPKLALQKLLMDVANEMDGDDAQEFIDRVAPHLSLNPQNLIANHFMGLLELFRCALKQCVISTNDVSKLKAWLKDIKAESILGIVQEYEMSAKQCLLSLFPAEGEPTHARVRSLSGPDNVHSGTPPQGEAGNMMHRGLEISTGSQLLQEEHVHTEFSQLPQAHQDSGVPSPQLHAQQTAGNVSSVPAQIYPSSEGPQHPQPYHPGVSLGTPPTRPQFQDPRHNCADTVGAPILQLYEQQTAGNVPGTSERPAQYPQPDCPSMSLGTSSSRPHYQDPHHNSSELEAGHGMHPGSQRTTMDWSMQYTPQQDVKPRTETQGSISETGNEGDKRQQSFEESEPGQSELVFLRALSDTGANSESSHRFRDSLQSAYENLPETVGYDLLGIQHLNPTLYQEVSSPENSHSQSPVTLEDVFSSESHKAARRALIVAEDEFGGTVVLIHAVQRWLERKVLANTPIVLYVPMQKLAEKANIDLDDILGIYSDSFQRNDNVREHIAQKDGEDVAFLFDGLNDRSISAVHDIIHGIKYSKASVYISCQPPVATQLKAPSTMVVKVGHLSEGNVQEFLYSCFADDTSKAEKIMQYRESLPTAKSLSHVPMYLAILSSIVGKTDLPNTDTQLAKLIVLYTLRFACARRQSQPPGSIELHDFDDLPAKEKQVLDDVCKLAFNLLLENKDHFTHQDLSNWSSDCKVSSLFASLLTTSTRLTEKGQPTTVYHFIDRSVQDYLSALYLSHTIPPEQWCQYVTEHAKLSNTLKCFCGIVGEKPEFTDNFMTAFEMIVRNAYSLASHKVGILPFRCAFEAGSADACTSLIRTTHQAVEIQSGSEILTPSDCSTIGYVVSRTSVPVTALNLSSCHFQSGCMESLVAQLEKPLHAVRRFDFSGTQEAVHSETTQHLFFLLEKLPSVVSLSLCSMNIRHEGQEKLLECISKNEDLQSLSLSRNSFTSAIGGKCGETVHMLKQLQKLDLSYNKIGDEGLKDMLPGLKAAHSLKELSLQECDLTSGKLISEIHKVEGLISLNLRGNSLRDVGIGDMMLAVENSHLEELSLADNGITQLGACHLTMYIQRSPHLKTLNLQMNDIPDEYTRMLKERNTDLNIPPTCSTNQKAA